ncbi:MAG: TVP38/TMEM64 family protein [Peptococcaceae bacterium]|nr:TVP38/TMEM64 family protein [Peptococcaceae bacterium]
MAKRILIACSILVVAFSVGVIIMDQVGPERIIWHGVFRDSRELADWLLSFGAWAVIISIAVMIIQTIATPVPLFLVAGANGFIFGVAWGIVITLVGALLGATVAFYLARVIARDYFSQRLAKYMPQVEEMSKKSGAKVIFLARLVPILPSSVVSYAAGLSKVSFGAFFVASVFGKLPEIVIYTFLGHSLERAEGLITKVTLVIIVLSLLCFSLQSKNVISLFSKKCERGKKEDQQ